MTDMQKESTLEFFARKNTKLEISEADGNTRGIFSKMEPLDQSRRVGTYEIATWNLAVSDKSLWKYNWKYLVRWPLEYDCWVNLNYCRILITSLKTCTRLDGTNKLREYI